MVGHMTNYMIIRFYKIIIVFFFDKSLDEYIGV